MSNNNSFPKYKVLTSKSILAINDECDNLSDDEFYSLFDSFGSEQFKTIEKNLPTFDLERLVVHFFDSPYTSDSYEKTSFEDAVQMLAIKEGYDVVRFENGNYGVVAYYGGKENAFEIIDTYVDED